MEGSPIDDVAFARAMVEFAHANWNIDPKRWLSPPPRRPQPSTKQRNTKHWRIAAFLTFFFFFFFFFGCCDPPPNPHHSVFTSGFSNGAFMTETLMCNSSDIFIAGASVSGTVVVLPGNAGGLQVCDTEHAAVGARRSLLHIHGNFDFVVPWTGDAILGFPDVQSPKPMTKRRTLNCRNRKMRKRKRHPHP
jgi:poly(3-hydroxybutyrate) depolymerase